MPKPQSSSRSQAIQQALQQAGKPLTFDELLLAAHVIFPMDAKSLKAGLNNLANNYSITSRLIQRTADGRYVWLPTLVPGTIFRHPLTEDELEKHHFLLEPEIVGALWSSDVGWGLGKTTVNWNCHLPNGIRIEMHPEMLAQRGWQAVWGIRGQTELWAWLESENAEAGDALFFKIEDVTTSNCSATFEPRTRRDEPHIVQRNTALADAAYVVCKPRRTGVSLTDLAVRLIAFGIYHDSCPPDPLESVLNDDARFMWEQERIKLATRYDHLYADLGLKEPDIWDILEEKPRQPPRKHPRRKELAGKVYLFHAVFRHSKGIWRRIEIRGDQSLAELDGEMRAAFGHDLSDHLSEFYLGTDEDSHERGLGDHQPFGGGEGDEWMAGELGLQPGDELSYTYDFGDNIQHILKLEAIGPREKGVRYPRVVEQNKPRYHYCERCKERGKKEIATWVCIECSNEKQWEVLICEEHLGSEHEDHYAEEIVY